MRRHTGSPEDFGGESIVERRVGRIGSIPQPHVDAHHVRVRDVMSRDLVVLPGCLSASALADRGVRARHGIYPVVDAAGVPVGLIDLAEVEWDLLSDGRTLAEVCTPLTKLTVVSPDDTVATPIPRLPTRRNTPALVTENTRLVGIVSSGSLLRFERAQALTARDPSPLEPERVLAFAGASHDVGTNTEG